MAFGHKPIHISSIGEVLISSRSLDEYRAMFRLTDADLARRILDCPGGAAGFAGEAHALGGEVIACDMVYSGHGPAELAALATAEADRGNRHVRAHPEQFEWVFFADPDAHQRVRRQAGQRFADHLRRHPERHVAGRLPSLPFADASVDLALSSHLLFSYSETLDHDFHVRSIRELMRVTREELRVFPLVAVGASEPYPRLDELLAELRAHGVSGDLVEVDYAFQRGAHQMLVCRHDSAARR